MATRIILIGLVLVKLALGQSGKSIDDNDDYQVQVCTTKNCYATAKDLLASMDHTVQPCEDFYKYACGGWIRSNPLKDGMTSIDRYEKLRGENDAFVKQLMKTPAARAKYSSVNAVQKAFQFFDSCMNMAAINTLGATPMNNLILQYGSWIVTDRAWLAQDWDLLTNIIDMMKDLGVKSLFELNVELGMTNNSFYFISLKQPSKFSLPRQSLSAKRHGKQAREQFQQFMENVTKALGEDINDNTTVCLKPVIRFERKLEKSALPDNSIDYSVMTIQEFQRETDQSLYIDWLDLLRGILSDTALKITGDTKIIVNGKRYFAKLVKHLRNTPPKTIANYMMWKLVYDLHLKLGQQFWDIHRDYQTSIQSSWEQSVRGDFCMEQLASLRGFAMPLTRVFVDNKFKGGNKGWLQNATDRIRDAFISNLDVNDWMDYQTNEEAKRKATALKDVIGYPDFIMNDAQLDQYFHDVVINPGTYFENVVSLTKFWTKRNYARIGTPKDTDQWSMSPVEINAQYEDSFNRMVFPVAILQPPFYNGIYTEAVNFGGIGTVMGHELTHGFDDSGKNYDRNGRRSDWWSADTVGKFQRKSKCLVDQYESFIYHGQKVNGKKSLSENIADNGGLKLAFRAYQNWVEEYGEEPMLPQANLTNEQVFFVSFAQNWCASYSAEGIEAERTSNYSPTPIRVNGSLRNFDEFTNAFNCPPGSPMNPDKKCNLW